MTADQKLTTQIKKGRESFVHLLQNLVRIAKGGEKATQEFIAARLEQLGCQVEGIEYRPESLHLAYELAIPDGVDVGTHTSIVGELPGPEAAPSLILFAHPDGEAMAGVDRWRHDPFAAEIEEGRLYGWGVADDLVGVAIMLAALETILASALKPRGRLILASTPSKNRAQGIIPVLDRGYLAGAAIYLHPAESGYGLEEIKAITLGMLEFSITIEGRLPTTSEPTHTPFVHQAVNPLDKAWRVYEALQRWAETRGRTVRYPPLDERVGRATNLHIAFIGCGDERKLTRVSSQCKMAGSITFPPTETMTGVQAQFVKELSAVTAADDWLRAYPPRLEWLRGTRGSEVPLEHPLYRTISRALVAVTGKTPLVNPLHAASDVRNPKLHKDIPTVGLGPLAGNFSQAGGVDEWVDIGDYFRAIQVVARVVLDWCGARA